VSSATVRNDMATLEAEGYLEQPHTSAGRIPTEKGYRFFVDTLGHELALGRPQRQQVSSFFAGAHGEIERMLEDTSRLLSSLTDYAAVVVAPLHEHATIRSVQLVSLNERIALLIVVLSTGVVEKHTIDLPDGADENHLAQAGNRLAEALVHAPHGSPVRTVPTGDPVLDVLLERCAAALDPEVPVETDAVFVGGASRMASAFDAVDTVKEVLAILEQQLVVVSLLHDVIDRGLTVAIGTETGMQPLAECAVVVAPYDIDGEPAGTIGVLGPTRMNYPQALAAVAVVSKRLGSHLSEG
jgi:heat-inducible transcriptional repressor